MIQMDDLPARRDLHGSPAAEADRASQTGDDQSPVQVVTWSKLEDGLLTGLAQRSKGWTSRASFVASAIPRSRGRPMSEYRANHSPRTGAPTPRHRSRVEKSRSTASPVCSGSRDTEVAGSPKNWGGRRCAIAVALRPLCTVVACLERRTRWQKPERPR